ncbi:MAG: ATP-binding protein [Polyangiaceae bacterium]|nr:ATP-binding protein [Polyangiaceae bacterium]
MRPPTNIQELQELADIGEKLRIEFKEWKTPGSLHRDSDFLRKLAKEISGFANTDGGLLVVGVDDKSRSLRPFGRFEETRAYLQKAGADLVHPHVPGLEMTFIPQGDDRGYAVVSVPPSDLGPHRSSKDHCYYSRSDELCGVMSHSVLAAMFGRRPPPALVPVIRVWPGGGFDDQVNIAAGIVLQNHGRGTARDAYLELHERQHFVRVEANMVSDRSSLSGTRIFVADTESIVTGTELHVATLALSAPPSLFERPASETFRVTVAADGMRPTHFAAVVTLQQLRDGASVRESFPMRPAATFER